jgi:hypothetical protein
MPSPYLAPSPLIQVRLLGVLAMIALMLGCSQGLVERRLVAPAQAPSQVRTCLDRCELVKTQCHQRQENRERACGEWYSEGERQYNQCREDGHTRCLAPTACLGADLGICDQEYETCFTGCGGQVETRLRIWPGTEIPAAASSPGTASITAPPG